MSSLLPLRSSPGDRDTTSRALSLDGDDADAVFGALSSEMAREVLLTVSDEPTTASEVADEVDSSVQNVRYHLDNLEDAGLVDVVDTWYSSRGREMDVYAATDDAIVVAPDESDANRIRDALVRLLAGLALLAPLSLLAQVLVERFTRGGQTGRTEPTTYAISARSAETAASGGSTVEPGLLFFAGGLVVLLVATAFWLRR